MNEEAPTTRRTVWRAFEEHVELACMCNTAQQFSQQQGDLRRANSQAHYPHAPAGATLGHRAPETSAPTQSSTSSTCGGEHSSGQGNAAAQRRGF